VGGTLTFGVVDQSPLREGGTAADALRESVKLAQVAEAAGYSRYWVAEHHNASSWAGTSPELLIGQIAAGTTTIRVGSGGVMLSHYSALKVAEQFRVLDAFYPGRIDLGIGRAPGSDQVTAAALAHPRPRASIDTYAPQIVDLLGFLEGRFEGDHPFAGIRAFAGPVPDTVPEVWLLGSSDFSARLAGVLGLPFAFADFFGNVPHGPIVADLYRREFKPSPFLDEPRVSVAVQVICAPTEEEAVFLGASRNINKLGPRPGQTPRRGLIPPDMATSYPLSDDERRQLESLKGGYIDGDPTQVRDRLLELAGQYGADEVGIVSNCYAFEDRVRSYELTAQALGIDSTSRLAGQPTETDLQ
jgi:luciferase family oxidoreductase group 1